MVGAMRMAQERALRMRAHHDVHGIITEDQLDVILDDLHVQTVEVRGAPDSLSEMVAGGTLFLARRLCRQRRRWLKAHAIGHVELHRGNQFAQARLQTRRQERQAEEFAGWLILGNVAWTPSNEHVTIFAAAVAEWADVPPDMLSRWWTYVYQAGVVARSGTG